MKEANISKNIAELRKKKGITMEEARLTTANPLYLGCLMVKAGDADGQVAGAMNTTGKHIRVHPCAPLLHHALRI